MTLNHPSLIYQEEKKKWAVLLETFLATENITLLLSLVDIRHDPTADDKMMVNYLYHYAVPFTLVATKADKLSKTRIKPRLKEVAAELRVGIADVIASSAENGLGKQEILSAIEQAIDAQKQAKVEQTEQDDED